MFAGKSCETEAVRLYHRGFTQASGIAELLIFPPIGHDGHILLPGADTVWRGAVADS